MMYVSPPSASDQRPLRRYNIRLGAPHVRDTLYAQLKLESAKRDVDSSEFLLSTLRTQLDFSMSYTSIENCGERQIVL